MRVLHKSGALGGVPLRFASGMINTGAIRGFMLGMGAAYNSEERGKPS